MVKLLFSAALVSLPFGSGFAWSNFQIAESRHRTTIMNAVSRRDVLSSMPAAFTILAAPQITFAVDEVVAEKSANEKATVNTSDKKAPGQKTGEKIFSDKKTATIDSVLKYQGVYMDPKHPKGYRLLVGDDKKANVQLQDDFKGEIFMLPVKIQTDKNKEEVKLAFDFSPKGGPKDAVAILGEKGGTSTLNFPDGNVWKKETGIIGVYKDGINPKNIRVIRKDKGSTLAVDLINGRKTTTISAKSGASKVLFDFPGKLQDPGTLNPIENTISFGDGNIWTKF